LNTRSFLFLLGLVFSLLHLHLLLDLDFRFNFRLYFDFSLLWLDLNWSLFNLNHFGSSNSFFLLVFAGFGLFNLDFLYFWWGNGLYSSTLFLFWLLSWW
jgi:hypothetical protein